MNVTEELRAEPPLYQEEQQFRQPWMLVLVVGASLLTLVLFGWGIYQQLILGKPWGNRPMSDTGLLVFAILVTLFMILLVVLLMTTKLTIRVQHGGLYIRYRPFIRRFIPFEQIAGFKAMTYRPILEYGGWGIRGFGGNMAYNVSGNKGVQLVLDNGKKLMLGTQHPDELEAAISAASNKPAGGI